MAMYYYGRFGGPYGGFRRWLYGVAAAVLVVVLAVLTVYWLAARDDSSDRLARPEGAGGTELEQKLEPVLETAVEPLVEAVPEVAVTAEMPRQSEAFTLIAESEAILEREPSRIIETRDRLNESLSMSLDDEQRAAVKETLSRLADKWLFSRTVYPNENLCETYMVQPGDLLSAIGARYKVPYQILMQINRVSRPELLRAGEPIKAVKGPFHARVYKSAFVMDLYLQNTFVRSFPVGLGRPGRDTPTGLWVVKPGGKLVSPTWTHPDTGKVYKAGEPDYPLGSRWIGLEGLSGDAKGRTGFAIHGTKDPSQIGRADSRGCIRLHNGDAVLIYNILTEGLSRVQVEN
jgi:LysM repeat protein